VPPRQGQRALLAALDAWVKEGAAPPASQHPRLSDRAVIAQSAIKYPDVPGGVRADIPGGPLGARPFLIPNVDKDGNDTAGLRLPELAVPLGTYTGWRSGSSARASPTHSSPWRDRTCRLRGRGPSANGRTIRACPMSVVTSHSAK
jgi:hypothetical protein